MNLFADPATRVTRDLKAADIDNMTPIQALDLWSDTGSRRCYEQVTANGRAVPSPGTREKL